MNPVSTGPLVINSNLIASTVVNYLVDPAFALYVFIGDPSLHVVAHDGAVPVPDSYGQHYSVTTPVFSMNFHSASNLPP